MERSTCWSHRVLRRCGAIHHSGLDGNVRNRSRLACSARTCAVHRHRPARRRPAPLPAASARRRRRRPTLWATVNVCDTATHPNPIGIRGCMPGLGAAHAHVHALPRPVPRRGEGSGATSKPARRLRLAPRRRRPAAATHDAGWSFEFEPPAPAARTCCAASSRSSGGAAGASCGARPRVDRGRAPRHGRRRARGLQRRDLRDRLTAQASNRRGSFVITPVTPSASSAADPRRVVDGPDVELAARLAQRAHEPRRDEPPVRHQRVAAAGAHVRGARPRAAARRT